MKTMIIAALAATAIPAVAGATTYSSGFNGLQQGGNAFQTTSVDAYGQYFTATGGTLDALSFLDTDRTTTGTQLVVQAFDVATLTAIGPVLYQGAGSVSGFGDGSNDDGSDFFYYHSFSNIGASLVAGQAYVAYLANATGQDTFNGVPVYETDPDTGEQYPVDSTTFFYGLGLHASDLGGAFVYRNPGAASGQTFVRTIDPTPGHDPYFQADYTIDISPAATAAVPEPASWAMLIAGFGLVGGAARRRGNRIVQAA